MFVHESEKYSESAYLGLLVKHYPTEVELRDKACELFIESVLNDEILDCFSRDHISANETLERLIYLKQWAEFAAPDAIAREVEDQRRDAV